MLRGRTALVTGASSGLGVNFARELARRGCHLVLTARREERLLALAGELSGRYGITVDVVPIDLAEEDAAARLHARTGALGRTVDVLINNAGLGIFGEFVAIPWERERQMLQVDLIALVHLTKLYVRDMVARDAGYVLMLSSIGAYQPSPTYATYAAAKSFVLNFGEALNYELRRTHVSVSVLSPGITRTEFLDVAGQRATPFQRRAMMESSDVARIGIERMLKRKPSTVPGLVNRVATTASRLLPRRAATAIAAQTMRER